MPAQATAYGAYRPPRALPPGPSRAVRIITVLVVVVLGMGLGYVMASRAQPMVIQGGRLSAAPSAVGEPVARLLPAPEATASTSYGVLDVGADGRPVTWSPCRPIHYVVRAENMPEGGREVIDSAFARLSQATGLAVVADGLTDEPIDRNRAPFQPERYGDRWAPVLVVWGKRTDVGEFMGDVAGMAGPRWAQSADGRRTYVTGSVYLDAEKFHEMTVQWGGDEQARAVVLHELGHLAGLAHSPDPGTLMWAENTGSYLGYTHGDLAGLAALGSGPCNSGV